MNESEDKSQQPERKFSQEQYDMLMRCSEKKDITEWNEWLDANPDEEIWLEGANLVSAYLEGAHFQEAHLERAILRKARLEGANLREAHLEHTNFLGANLEGVILLSAYLEGAILLHANLENAILLFALLEGTDFTAASVDGKTVIQWCKVNRDTNFTAVNLDAARVGPGLKQLLQYNIRRKRWREWYKKTPWWKRIPTKVFWLMSDYGRSTGWVIGVFFGLALLFAGIYYACGLIWHPGIIANLFEDQHGPIPPWLVPFRAVYFSIVTMTTLGFGDMHANARDLVGHLLLTLQVLLGYVLLGALITRFAVLFTAGGPAAKFADKKKTHSGD